MPVEALLQQFRAPKVAQGSDISLLRSFDLMYIKMGIKRMPIEKQSDLVSLIIPGISQLGDTHASSLFNILLTVLPNLKLPERGTEESDKLKSVFGFDSNPEDAAYLAEKFTQLFLLDLAPLQIANPRPPFRCPGLTPEQFNFLTKDSKETFNTQTLTDAKVHSIRFLLSGAFTEDNLYFPLLVASQDPSLSVNRPAENHFKKIRIDLEDSARVNFLYRLFLGSSVDRLSPVKSSLQVQVLQILSKSTLAVNLDPKSIVFEALTSQYYRLVQTGFTFLKAITSKTNQPLLETFAHDLLEQVKDVITKAGWPKVISGDMYTLAFRPLAYQAIGAIISRVPDLLKDLKYFDFLLKSLEQDSADLKPSIQEALSGILPAIDKLSSEAKDSLKASLFKILSDPSMDDSSKHIAIKVAVRSYHFSDASARVLCLLGLRRENRPDIIEEAKRGLHPHWFKAVNAIAIEQGKDYKLKFPEFGELIQLIKTTSNELVHYQDTTSHSLHGFSLSVYDATMQFLERVLIMEAVSGKKTALVIDEDWDTRIETAIEMDDLVRSLVIKYIPTVNNDNILDFLQLSFDGLKLGHADVQNCAKIWRRTLSLSPPEIVIQKQNFVDPLIELLAQPKLFIRETSAFGLGMILCQLDDSNISSIAQITKTMVSFLNEEVNQSNIKNLDKLHGTLLSLGTIISRLFVTKKLSAVDPTGEIFEQVSTIISKLLASKTTLIIEGSLTALSQLAIFGALYMKPESYFDELKSTLVGLVSKKESEKAVLALGYLSLSDVAFSKNKSFYVEKVTSFTQSKHTEFMFSSGEALSVIASGWNSKVLNRSLDIQVSDLSSLPRSKLDSETDYLNETLDSVISNTKSTKPIVRKFACIWLISLLQYCGHLKPVQEKLEQIHLLFMKYLPEGDELVQETASRGLSMVYEMGNTKLKDTLVRNLVQSFTADSTKRVNAGSVSDDTQLFEPGVLNTGDGSVSTYKDILNLASELGDPSLIYRFMSLAANSALWSSRKGAAFGLGGILSKANLDEIFENNERLSQSLVPKLYRYRYDPNPSVQQAMRGIWDTLIKDKTSAINENFGAILKELLTGMGDKEWRVRQASSTALADLLQGKPIEMYQDHLEKIWAMSFRAVDDIKDSVRTAGMALTKSLTTTLIRYVDVENGASSAQASQVLNHLIPFLMGHQGLQSDAQEIQSFALNTLIKLSKKGGSALKPFIPEMVEELILLMSTLEPQAINYIALNADKYGLTNNAIDASRLASIRGSPLMEAIEELIDQATDEQTMAALVPKISSAVRKSVGLPSKVGASRVLVALCVRHMQQVAPFADTLLVSSQRQLNDRNDTISQSFAASCGYLCRLASDKAVLKYVSDIRQQYFTAETERPRLIVGHAVNGISKHAGDKFQNVATAILPFVFIAKHDSDKAVKDLFTLVWSDNTGGSGAIRLYIKEILEMASSQLGSQQWLIRQVAAQSVADASNTISNDLVSSISSVNIDLGNFFEVLIEACKGRSWSGKELVFNALVLLATKATEFVKVTPEYNEKLDKVVMTEVKRRNKEYQIQALGSMGIYVHHFPSEELYDTLYEQSDIYLDPEDDTDEDEEMVDVNQAKDNSLGAGILSKKEIEKEEKRNKILESIVDSFVFVTDNGDIYKDSETTISKTCDYLANVLLAGKKTRSGPVSWRTHILAAKMFSRLTDDDFVKCVEDGKYCLDIKKTHLKALDKLWNALYKTSSLNLNHENVRIEAANSVASYLGLLQLVDKSGKSEVAEFSEKLKDAVIKQVRELKDSEKSNIVKTRLAGALDSC